MTVDDLSFHERARNLRAFIPTATCWKARPAAIAEIKARNLPEMMTPAAPSEIEYLFGLPIYPDPSQPEDQIALMSRDQLIGVIVISENGA
ncbi:MAG: hypothetical protein AAF891_11340 [Pseudomonadota bacterium]